jgi:hypothetical protein
VLEFIHRFSGKCNSTFLIISDYLLNVNIVNDNISLDSNARYLSSVDDCFAHNKGFIRPHLYCVRPELGGGTLEGSKRVAGSWDRRWEISMVLGVELSGPILSARRRTCPHKVFCPDKQ